MRMKFTFAFAVFIVVTAMLGRHLSAATCAPTDVGKCCGDGLKCLPPATRGAPSVCGADPSNICKSAEVPPIGGGGGCTRAGCGDPICGKGYACVDGACEVNPTCVGSVIEVPYTGPKIESLGALIGRIYNVFFPAALIVGVLMIIKGGYEIMTSEGNPQLAKAGQEDLTAAVLGTLFIVMSGMILRMIIVQILGGSVGF